MWTKGEQNCTIPYGDCNSLKRFTSAYLFLIVRQKSWEYLLMIFLQKYHQLSALISLFCTLISLGSIDVLSANQCAEIFACTLLQVSNCFVPVSRPMWRNPDSGIQQMRGFGIRNPLCGIPRIHRFRMESRIHYSGSGIHGLGSGIRGPPWFL